MRARDAVEAYTEIEGLVYHHRGLQVPGYSVMFLTEDDPGTFRVEVGAVGPREAWTVFDASLAWEMYLMLFDGGAVAAWMSDKEFEVEEADRFESKAQAILAGRFSFAVFFLFGPDWVERESWAETSTAPALLQVGTGELLDPETKGEYDRLEEAIPEEFRTRTTEQAPSHLGVLDANVAIDTDPS